VGQAARYTRRDATVSDLPRIVEIYNGTIPSRTATADLEPVSVESRLHWYSEHEPARRPLWVVDIDGDVQAWLSLSSFHERSAYDGTAEVSVYVSEAHRAAGVGSFLLGEAIERAPDLGLHTLVALVFGHNAASIALFSRFGFEPWGWLPGVAILDGVARDLAILGRPLAAATEASQR
jgi:L-amino acid N-acyltransferase YncA